MRTRKMLKSQYFFGNKLRKVNSCDIIELIFIRNYINHRGVIMAASYKKLFKLLIDRDMKKKELAEKAGISIATITKMGKDGAVVSSDVLVKICTALNCTMDDIVEIMAEK